MPKVSRETASDTLTMDGYEGRYENLDGGYTVGFESSAADADLADLFRGLTIGVIVENLRAAGVEV
jgi:hypothetical protein